MKKNKSMLCQVLTPDTTVFYLMLVVLIAISLILSACDEDRVLPVEPDASSHTETIMLLDDVPANGQDLRATFELLGDVVDGFITIACFMTPDPVNAGWNADLEWFERMSVEMDSIDSDNQEVDVAIINIELQGVLTPEDSLKLDSLRNVKTDNLAEIGIREFRRDSLDTWLDDRFKLSIWMNNDTTEFYPNAVYLDSNAYDYLGDQTSVWGQGFYLAPPELYDLTDTTSFRRGKTVRLDLEEFWIADGGWDIGGPYFHDTKPTRGTQYTNQYPIRDLATRLDGALHFRFGEANTNTRVTASLYVVYSTAERR
ncbi:MAG: hypothetical protein P9X24_03425 [Candidatus Hatepunaea meridiana]|nr:hypothetical protein [Candidatus Hatepunaea meridiana]